MANLNLPKLDARQEIVDRKGLPNALFLLHWQRYGLQLEDSAEGLAQTVNIVAAQQAVIVQLLGLMTQNIIYLNEMNEWLVGLGQFSSQRIAYLQAAVAGIATQVGYDLPDPSGLPDYPGPVPVPPWEDPGP